MGRAWNKFCLLFWKNWLLQRRHRLQTVIEILVPVIFCALLVVIRSLVVAETIDRNTVYEPFSPAHIPRLSVNFPIDCNDSYPELCNSTYPSFESEGTNSNTFKKLDIIEGMGKLPPDLVLDEAICQFLFEMTEELSDSKINRKSESKSIYQIAQEKIEQRNGKMTKEMKKTYDAFSSRLQILYQLFPEIFGFYSKGTFTLERWIFLWSPNNTEVNRVMKEASAKLPVIGCPVENSNILKEKITKPLLTGTPEAIILAGVVFPDDLKSTSQLPPSMNVTIRFPGESRYQNQTSEEGGNQNSNVMPKTWNTNYVFPLYQVPGPRNKDDLYGGSPGYYQEGFLGVQNAVFSSLLNYHAQRLGIVVPKIEIELKRFPYPKFIDDKLLPALESFVPVIIMLSFLYTAVSTVRTVTTEKEKQLKEAMKMMGLSNWLHWTAWFTQVLIMFFISVVLIVILLKTPLGGNGLLVLPYSDWSCILAFLFVYIIASITFCFAISVFFSKASTAAVVSGMIWFICYLPYFFLQEKYSTTNLATKLGASLLSNTAMAYGFQIMLMYEGTGAGLQWSNLWSPVTPDDTLTMGHIMGFLIIDSIIYMCLTIYVEAIFPGEYGVPQPWNFPFKKSFWCGEKAQNYVETNENLASYRDSDIYEKEPRNLKAGVQIKQLRKVYNKDKVAVDDLTLNMYEGQITVLLGHNGAGKTTTMSMLTGLFTPTSGTALVGGHDIRTDIQGVRETLGLCPQHNVLFEELTVSEHLRFFGKLKGLKASEIKEETEKYLQLLNLEDKANAQAKALSGGMQRKLAAAVALCGKSKVVLFDEPTSGMDPSARRSLWDLLQGEKEGRTILLTTHFMDEADLLGDRIAIMSEGKLQCCGSSFFLKKKYGGGYYLVMVKSNRCNPENVTEFLRKYIPDIIINANIGSELSYCLEEKYSYKFEEMFNEIEEIREELGILSYGVSLTTMEEVFMKVGSESEVSKRESGLEETDFVLTETDENNYKRQNGVALTINKSPLLKGWNLARNQIAAMFSKYITAWYRSWLLYIIIILIPVIDLTISILVAKSLQGTNDLPAKVLNLQDFPDAVVTIQDSSQCFERPFCEKLALSYKSILQNEKVKVHDLNEMNVNTGVDEYLISQSNVDVGTVSQTYILGTKFDAPEPESLKVTGWFNNQPYHIPPAALSYIYNAIFKAFIDPRSSYTISNHPLPFTEETKVLIQQTGGNVGFQIAFNIGFSFAFVTSYFLIFYIRERICKAKLLQFVSGINVFTFWTVGYIWNFITSLGPILAVIITLAAFQEDGFSTFDQLGRCFLLMICCAFATLPLTYLASFLFKIPAIGFARMIFFNVFTGLASFIVVMVLQTPSLDLVDVADTLDWIFTFLPSYSLTYSFANLNKAVIFLEMCEPIYENYCKKRPDFKSVCCKDESQCPESGCVYWTSDYFDWKAPGVGRNIVFFFVDGIVLFTILLLIEHRFWEMITYRSQSKLKPVLTSDDLDSDVLAENELIQNIADEKKKNYNLLLQGVTKYYNDFLAVKNLNLAVEKGECFGLLGVNGAGKTSTFKMLTGDEKISFGDAYVNGLSLKYQMKRVNQLIGYCPQFDALIDDLTGREILRLFCLLRGVPKYEIKLVSEKLAKELLFFKHIDKKVKEYSGGNKRKLSTAVALIGDPPVVYLDEPTTGMDPVAKRHLWNVICKVRSAGKTIILTSHSMEECEALCTRLAIMVNGEFKCLGSTQHLKTKFAQGYTLIVKPRRRLIAQTPQRQSGDSSQINHQQHKRQRSSISVRKLGRQDSVYSTTDLEPIKNYIQDHFEGATLKEEYQGLLTYHISASRMTWAKMFGLMESAKRTLDIEDYSLGQTSLEQVFLSFTKYQQNRNQEE